MPLFCKIKNESYLQFFLVYLQKISEKTKTFRKIKLAVDFTAGYLYNYNSQRKSKSEVSLYAI
ncbi:hypothetical protein CSTERTH_09890 [Thermoclostridium stercorarium subsp. thermolacticum DSM 2910]|uniref:Uncharacterized protein n=2 Tax=Thermoclostridium stercorarium TaxID=1510 RepID=A0A1B1YME2_THEST|nr:hypothetical protein CSTERTH_09890 [Thermoclostridium stercorarium subsp. thermolacticum DSM 2910]ANX01947.1 hypothetical protein CSTERLE_10380 [Thermoclostridium stercorarium subsp. leptospartum DSM 9219]